MPYASSIQVVNDANGVAHGFLADNGAIWHCQWDPQAQVWNQGQLVPQAFGGEKLQALYLDQLWPPSSGNPEGLSPGIVLAYRIGEGRSAEIFASFGQWGSNGELGWSLPLQLTQDQLDEVAFSLVPAEEAVGGFSLVAQKRQADTPAGTLLDQLGSASSEELPAKLEATLSGSRPDSDLYVTQFNLEVSESPSAWAELSIPGTTFSESITAAPSPVIIAAAPAPFAGNTQLSRQQLSANATQPPSTALMSSSLEGTSGGDDDKQSANYSGALAHTWSKGGQWRTGMISGSNLTSWGLETPFKNPFKAGPDSDPVKNPLKAGPDLDPGSNNRLLQFRWDGSFGIRNIGAGLTSVNTMKMSGSVGNDNKAKSDQWKQTAEEGGSDVTGYVGFGGMLYSEYSYQGQGGLIANISLNPSQKLQQILTQESVGIDSMLRLRYIAPGGNSAKLIVSEFIGYMWSQQVTNNGDIPSWIADLGYYSGMVGNAEKMGKAAYGGLGALYKGGRSLAYKLYLGSWFPSEPKTAGQMAEREENTGIGDQKKKGFEILNWVNAFYGTALAITNPSALASIKGVEKQKSSGIQNETEMILRVLWHSAFGVELKISNILQKFLKGAEKGSLNDYLYIAAGGALPLGGFMPLISYYHSFSSGAQSTDTVDYSSEEGVYPSSTTQEGTSTSTTAYIPAPSGNAYPFTYGPSSANNIYFGTSDQSSQSIPLASPGAVAGLNKLTLNTYQLGLNSVSANPSVSLPLTLVNAGTGLKDGTYTNVAILGVTISGGLKDAALAGFTVSGGSINPESFKITRSGNYLALPEASSTSPASYALLLDVFTSGIANPPNPSNAADGNPFANLPLITVAAGASNSPLAIQSIQSVQTVSVQPASQPAGVVYPEYDPKTKSTQPQPANNNATYIYSDVAVNLLNAATQQLIEPINPGVTATVYLNAGLIQQVVLSQPLLFSADSGSAANASNSFSIQLQLPPAVVASLPANTAQPSFAVTPQSLALNNFVEDDQFSGQSGAANAGVYLSAGLSDQLPLYSSMGKWPVQNRVTYVAASANGQPTFVYLNGLLKSAGGGFAPEPATTAADLSLSEIYSNHDILFTAASTPTAATITGPASTAYANKTFVAWVEASNPVIPISTASGAENFQAYMEAFYGDQRINYRINTSGTTWLAPDLKDLYHPDGAIINHLQAVNVADPAAAGQERTLLVWSEISIAAIKEQVQSFGSSGSTTAPIPTTLKVAWLNPNPKSYQWNDLFADANGNSTIQTIPWNPTKDVGLGIDDISVASLPLLSAGAANGALIESPVISWSQDVRTPYTQSVLNDKPAIYLKFDQLQAGVSAINIGTVKNSSTTATSASATGLNFAIQGALPASQATAVQNSDGTGVLATGMGTINRSVSQILDNIPADDLNDTPDPIALFTGSITGTLLTVTSLSQGSLAVGDVISGDGIAAGTIITAITPGNPSNGTGSYTLNTSQSVASTSLISTPNVGVCSFTGSIAGTVLTVTSLTQGNLHVGDLISGQGIADGTIITAINPNNPSTGTGLFTVNNSQTVSTTGLVASPGLPTVPYTIEFWAQLQPDSNPGGAGLVALGQPSDGAIGAPTLPEGWLLTSSFVVDQITWNEAAARGLIASVPSSVTDPGEAIYGWGWAVLAEGANTTAMNGNGGSNLYSNAVQITNFVSGSQLAGVNSFLQAYSLSSSDLIGLNGTNAATIAQVPLSQLQFSNAIDPTSKLPNSSLNAIALDTNSAVLNQGMVLAGSSLSPDLQTMFDNLWQFQLKTGEAKVNFSLAPTTPPSSPPPPSAPPSELSSENYSGYALDFSLSRGTAVSVNGKGELVFDVAAGTSLTSSSVGTTIPKDLRDGQWHYIVASYLPAYQTYNVEGNITQLPGSVGTATLYIDNKLVASNANILGAHPPINPNDQALLLANNAGGAIDQLAFYDKALTSVDFKANTSGQWPAPSAADALSLLSTTGYGIANQTPDLGTKPGAVNAHWYARNVNPNDALLGTFYSTFTPNGNGGGSWSEASNLNPTPIVQATLPSASRPGSLQDNLVIVVPAASWATSDWIHGRYSTNSSFNPSGQHLRSVSVTLTTTSNSGDTSTFTLRPDQVLLGDQTLQSLQPQATVSGVNGATTTDYNYFVPTNLPAFTLLVDKNQLPDGNSYTSASYTFSFIETTGATLTVKPYRGTLSGSISGNKLTVTELNGPLAVGDLLSAKDDVVAENTFITGIVKPFDSSTKTGTYTVSINQSVAWVSMTVQASVNAAGSDLASVKSQGYATSGEISASQRYSSTIATAAVIEQAPLQLKYIDSGEILKSSSSAAASSESTASPAPSFGTSQVVGSFPSTDVNSPGLTNGWLAIAQPQSINAASNPAGRIWIQYTGQYTVTTTNGITSSKASTSPAQAPNTWLNALSQSNFSPDAPNLPLLGAANNPSSSGGLLIQADPTVGWGENFGQTMLVADVNYDGVDDLVIGAPQANGGGRVYIIDGKWIAANLTSANGNTILNLANPNSIGNHVTVLVPSSASSPDNSSAAGFGSALAYNSNSSSQTLWIGAPNYLSQLNPNDATNLQPVGALYSYQYSPTDWTGSNAIPPILQPWGSGAAYSLATSILGTGGSATSPDLSGTATTIYWGSQFGSAIAVDQASGAMAVSAPGVYAAMVYSGTEGVQEQVASGSMKPSDTYGDGALIKIQLPGTGDLPNVSIANGANVSAFVDIVNQDQLTQNQKDGETSYMQNLKALQVDNIAKATVYNNQALQVNAVGAVYLFNSSSTSPAPANASSTYYGPNPWNVLGASGFGSSLAFGDLTNTNKSGILAVGADQTGGSGAVYFIDTSVQPQSTLGANHDNQYLAHLASGLTLYGAQAQDRFGNGLVNLGDTNNDGYDDVLIQAFNASSGAGNGYVLFGSDNLIDSKKVNNLGSGNVAPGSIGDIKRVSGPGFKASILSELGYGLSSNTGQGTFGAGDINGDGLFDIPLGSGPNGSAYLTWGHPYLEAITNLQLDKLASNTGYMLDGLATSTQGSLRSIGDFNGDGYGDFISIQPGSALTTVRIELGANTQEVLADYLYNDYFFTVGNGTQVSAAGDINGDGFSDLALLINQDLSTGSQGAGSTLGMLYGRPSDELPVGSGFGYLSPVNQSSQPLIGLPGLEVSGGLSDAQPAVISVGNDLYAVVKGDGASSLWFAQSSNDGQTWTGWTNLTATQSGLASNLAPSLAYFNGRLYLAFLNTAATPTLSLSSWDPNSNTPSAWSTPTALGDGTNAASFSSKFSPQLIDRGDALGVVWVDAASGTLSASYSITPDQATALGGLGAPTPWSPLDGGSSPATPALARIGDTVYMAVQGNGNNYIYWNSSSDGGVTWGSAWNQLPTGMTSAKPPSLAVVNGTLYLSYLGYGNNEINITSLDTSSNSWSNQYVIPGQSAAYASLVAETVGTGQQLAVYYVSNDSTDRILKAYSKTPGGSTATGWIADVQIQSNNTTGLQTASGPLAVTTYENQTYIAYLGGTTASPSNTINVTTSAGSSAATAGTYFPVQSTFTAASGSGLGLTNAANGLILSYAKAGSPNTLQLKQLSPQAGQWVTTDSYVESLPTSLSSDVSILSLNGTSGPGLVLAGINTSGPTSGYGVQTSLLYPVNSDTSWNTPRQLQQRVASSGTIIYQPIVATTAPSLTWLGQDAVVAVNNSGTVNVYESIPSSLSWQLASSFTAASGSPQISTAPVLATTDTGLALTYGTSDGAINLKRLNLLNAQGELLTAPPSWSSTVLNQANGGLSSDLATVPLSVDGTLLLANVRNANDQIWLNAVPSLGDPASTTWINSTVQLSDGQGGWSISQQGSDTLTSVAPTWSVVSNGQSPEPPAFAEANGVLYAAVRGTNNEIYWNYSNDGGMSWSSWQVAGANNGKKNAFSAFSTTVAPALSVVNDTLYLAYVGDGNSQINISSLSSPSSTAWSNQYQIPNQGAKTISMVNEAGNLALYYQGTNDNIYRTSTTTPTSSTAWQENSIQYDNGSSTQTTSGQLVVTMLGNTTYLAYQGGTSSNPSNTIYLTSSDTQSNGSSWNLINDVPQADSASHSGVGLTTLNDTLLLSYADQVNSKPVVALQQGVINGGFWRGAPYGLLQSPGATASPQASLFVPGGSSEVLVASINASSSPAQDITTTFAAAQPLSQLLTSGQTGSTLSPVGDLNNDGFADLLVSANNVAANFSSGRQLATGLRVISGSGSPQALAPLNGPTAAKQAVQLAPALPVSSPASVAASISAPGTLSLTATSAAQRYGLSASLSDPSSLLATAGSLSSAQQLFSSAFAPGSPGWSSTPTPPLAGNPALNTASTFGDLNGDGYNDYFDPDGSIWIASAPEGPVFSLWSIRAAGDVNGNGVDDVLLALTPQGPSYPAQSDGKPSAIYSALIDGALFKVSNNSFNLSDLKAALNPYNSIELFDVTTMSSSDEYQSLQNWFSPIVKYQAPIEIESVQTLVTGNSAFIGSAQTSSYNNSPAPTLVHDASGNLYSITTLVIGGGNNTGILLSNTLLLGVGQNSLDPNAIEVTGIDLTKASPLVAGGKTFPSDSIAPLTPGAAIHDGKLFVAIPSATSGNGYGSATNNIWIAYADLNNSDKPLTEATSWTTYQVQSNGGVSAEYSLLTPTLVSEGERLALYFPSGDEGNSDENLNIHYLYSNDPTQQTGWGSSFSPTTNTYTGTSSTITIDASLSTTPSTGGWASTSGVIVTSPIAATTYQGRTVLAFRGYGDGTGDNVENGALLLAFAPTAVQRAKANIAGSSSTTDWTLWDTGITGINTPSIATDQANLYLTYTPWSTSATNAEFFPVALNIDQLAPSKQVTLNSDSLIKAGATYTLPITLQQAGDDTVTNDGNIGMTSPYYAGGYFKDADTQANNIGNAPQSVTPSFIGDALYVTNQIGESAAVAINYNQEEAAFGSNQINQAGFSLAGYSIDGNIDVNGDGFTDVLLSDPSDPAIGVNNQYVLFGGDYLNIASQVGTAGNDTLIGTPLADVIYTLGGADGVQSKGGADVIYTGSGDDQISIADNAFVRIDAGSGFDQLRLQGQAGQSYDFSLNVAAPQYFVGTKLNDIELISSIDYGSNTLSIDAAAINAINPDRVIFLTPDSADLINFSAELKRSLANDINYGGSLWYAYAAPGAAGPSANPTLAYVRVPDGNDAPSWLASQVSVGAQGQAPMLLASLSAPSAVSPGSQPAGASPSMVAGSTNFGDGLTITAYRTSPNSGLARFRISRSGDLSRSQLISYVSSSLNSSSEPGRHHTPVAGLLRLEAGQSAADITVPVDGAAIAELRNGTLSLQVAELDDLGQKQVHLLLDVAPTSAGLRPVLSGLNLQVDDSGKAPSIGFRADINQAASAKGLASTLNLKVLRRQSADSSATDPKTRSQNLVISEGALAKFDQDDLNNGQVELQFDLNATTGSIQLQAANPLMQSLVLSKLDPARKPITVGIDLTTTTLDALPMKEPPGGVVLNKTAVDFTVSADGNGQAKLFLDLTQVGDDLVISEDQNGVRKRKANSLLAYYGIDNVGNLTPLTYNAIHRAGARFYDTDGDGIADFVSLIFLDGGLGDTGLSGDGKIHDPSTAGTVDLGNLTLDVVDNQRTLKPSASQNKEASASLVLNAVLNGRAATSNQIGYVVRDAKDKLTFDQIFADLTQLRGRAQTLFSTLESSDVTLAAGTSLSREILLIYGQSVRFFEVVDSSLDLLSNASDPRLQIFTSVGQANAPVEFSSLSGVSLSLALVTDRDQGLNALIGQEQGLAPILDFTSFTVDQKVVGTYSLAREASLDAVTGFYRALDINGTVWIDPTDHSKGTLTPGQAGTTAAAYGAAALKNMVDSLTGLRVGNRQSTAAVAITLQESSYLAPIAQVNGNTFVAYAQGNQDGIAHFVSLANGTFGLEDLLGGGDRDFDDQVIGFVFQSVTTVV